MASTAVCTLAWAVITIQGISIFSDALSLRTSSPLIPGIIRSSRKRSNLSSFNNSRPDSPSGAVETSNPFVSRKSFRSSLMDCSSSMTRMRFIDIYCHNIK